MRSKSTIIYAPSGYGKSYLILRAADNLRKKGYRIKVITAESFTVDLISVIRTHKYFSVKDFCRQYKGIDAIFIEDIQSLKGRTSVQSYLGEVAEWLIRRNCCVVFTMDHAPTEADWLMGKLKNRITQSMQVKIDPPTFEQKRKMISLEVENEKLKLTEHAIETIAKRAESPVEIMGIIKHISLYVNELDYILDEKLLEKILKVRGK